MLDGDARLALTGTPLENRLSELWSQFDFLMPGFLGSADGFHDRFEHLRELERSAFTHRRPAGAGAGSTHQAGMMEESEAFRERDR